MLEADYYEKIGELVAEAVLEDHDVKIFPYLTSDGGGMVLACVTVSRVSENGLDVVEDNHKGEAEALRVGKAGVLEAIIEALEEASEGL